MKDIDKIITEIRELEQKSSDALWRVDALGSSKIISNGREYIASEPTPIGGETTLNPYNVYLICAMRNNIVAILDAYDRINDFEKSECAKLLMKIGGLESELRAYRASGLTPDRAAELGKADAEGRVVVLPCRVGDRIWGVDDGEVRELRVTYLRSESDGEAYLYAECVDEREGCHCYNKYCAIRFSASNMHERGVFLTREEADAALGEQKND